MTAALTTVVMAGVMTAPGAQAAIEVFDNGAGGERYVALGDSAAAGPIIIPQRPGGSPCYRSERNFATYTAAALRARSFTDATCSSAKIDNMTAPQDSEPPQLNSLRADTTLVTLGPIGANDVGIVGTVSDCIAPLRSGCKERDGQTVHTAIDAIAPELDATLAAIKRRSPKAAIVVVGYGLYVPPGACFPLQPVTASDAEYVQGLIDHTNAVLKSAARRAGAEYADLRNTPGAIDHTACAPVGQRWVEGVSVGLDGAIPFHPTALGMEAYSTTVITAARQAKARQAKAAAKARAQAQIKAAAKKLRGQAVCRGSKVRIRVLTRGGPVVRADFKVGKKLIRRDNRVPFTIHTSRKGLKKRSGKLTARVKLQVPGAAKNVTVKIGRPRCAR